ncbi:MAG: RNA-binding protein [Alphaproteobacteria bacterium]|nr:RNA-binding protein [Alphaproteobacteria bacterium]
MPIGPKGEIRPADVVGRAITVAKIAAGELKDSCTSTKGRQKVALAGGQAEAKKISEKERSNIAKTAAKLRWGMDK